MTEEKKWSIKPKVPLSPSFSTVRQLEDFLKKNQGKGVIDALDELYKRKYTREKEDEKYSLILMSKVDHSFNECPKVKVLDKTLDGLANVIIVEENEYTLRELLKIHQEIIRIRNEMRCETPVYKEPKIIEKMKGRREENGSFWKDRNVPKPERKKTIVIKKSKDKK